MINLETPHTKETETIQTTGKDHIKITDHETIQIMYHALIIITIDHVTILKIDFRIIKIHKENFPNHRTEIIHNTRIHNKTVDKLIKYNQLKKPIQALPVFKP